MFVIILYSASPSRIIALLKTLSLTFPYTYTWLAHSSVILHTNCRQKFESYTKTWYVTRIVRKPLKNTKVMQCLHAETSSLRLFNVASSGFVMLECFSAGICRLGLSTVSPFRGSSSRLCTVHFCSSVPRCIYWVRCCSCFLRCWRRSGDFSILPFEVSGR